MIEFLKILKLCTIIWRIKGDKIINNKSILNIRISIFYWIAALAKIRF